MISGKTQIEMIGCAELVCDANAEASRQKLNLAAPVGLEYKPEYASAAAEGEALLLPGPNPDTAHAARGIINMKGGATYGAISHPQ